MWRPLFGILLSFILSLVAANPSPNYHFFLQETVYGQYAVARASSEEGPLAFIEPSINQVTSRFHITNGFLITGSDQKAYAIESNSDLNPFGFKPANVKDLAMLAKCEIKNNFLQCKAGGRADFYVCMNPANHLYIGKGKDIASKFKYLDCKQTKLRVVDA